MIVSNLIQLDASVDPIAYTPRGIVPIGICINPDTGKKYVILEVVNKSSRVSNFLDRLDSYKNTHYFSKAKKNPFSYDSLGFLSMLGVNISDASESQAFALGAYAYVLFGGVESNRSFSEALYTLESSGRDTVREKTIRTIAGAASKESRATHIASTIRIMSSKNLSFNIRKMVEDLLYKSTQDFNNAWIQEFYGAISNSGEEYDA